MSEEFCPEAMDDLAAIEQAHEALKAKVREYLEFCGHYNDMTLPIEFLTHPEAYAEELSRRAEELRELVK